jgi:adenylate cyclase class 2
VLEREVKLSFESPSSARAAIVAARATLLHPRRLQHDVLFDTPDGRLRQQGCALRLRHENGTGVLTFKGPMVASSMKVREEHETVVTDPVEMRQVLNGLGYQRAFVYEKYREEYALAGVVIALDETPIGTFVELEGSEESILRATDVLGRTPNDFVLDSYRTLFLNRRGTAAIDGNDMVFVRT